MASESERQLKELERSVEGLIEVNESVVTVHDAIEALTDLIGPATTAMAETEAEAAEAAKVFQDSLLLEMDGLRADNERLGLRLVELNGSMDRFWKRAEIDGLLVRNERAAPIFTSAA
jgi:hypothetical protein